MHGSVDEMTGEPKRLSAEQLRRRRRRSIALAIGLGLLAVLFYAITVAKLGPGVLDRPL